MAQMLKLHPNAMKNFDEKAEELIFQVAEYVEAPKKKPPKSSMPDIHISPTFTDKNFIGVPEMGFADGWGNETGKLFRSGKQRFGFWGENYKNLRRIAEAMQKTKELRNTVSVQKLVDLIFYWVEKRLLQQLDIPMTSFVIEECEKIVEEVEVWVPIAWLHIQSEIKIGRVTFKTISREMMDRWLALPAEERPPQEEAAIKLAMDRERTELQGFAAATIKMIAEPNRAEEIAFEEAEFSTGLLRFFSPANVIPQATSYCTLQGKEHIPKCRSLIVKDNKIDFYTKAVIDKSNPAWLVSNIMIAEYKELGLDIINKWLESEDKTDFQQSILDSLSIYSRASLASNPTDKLIYILVALESILLKDNKEAIQNNLGERIAFSIGNDVGTRKFIITNTKKIYELRSAFIHHGQQIGIDEFEEVQKFMLYSWDFFHWLIKSVDRGLTRDKLFDLLEERKLS